KLGDDAVDWKRHACPPILASAGCAGEGSGVRAAGNIVRISKIEITGRKRMKRYKSVTNSPMEPMNIDQSHGLPWYMPQEDGRKSRLRLITIITYRSSHMPMLMIPANRKSAAGCWRIVLNHKSCGMITLHVHNAQYIDA